MERRFRLNRSTDFKRVRREGRTYAHPLIVLIALPNDDQRVRIGVAAGRSIGNAVVRNRSKRLLRASMQGLLSEIKPGWNIVLMARQPMIVANYSDVREAVYGLLRRAHVIRVGDGC